MHAWTHVADVARPSVLAENDPIGPGPALRCGDLCPDSERWQPPPAAAAVRDQTAQSATPFSARFNETAAVERVPAYRLHPPPPLVGVSIAMERERQQNDSLADGHVHPTTSTSRPSGSSVSVGGLPDRDGSTGVQTF